MYQKSFLSSICTFPRNKFFSDIWKNFKQTQAMMSTLEKENDSSLMGEKNTVKVLDPPVKSANDKKEYRVIRLQNGLTALLISDIQSLINGEETEENNGEEMSTDDEMEADDSMSEESEKEKEPKTADEKLSAASLTIGVGSFMDPDEIPGLAHFLEHMVFMGSAKFPQENDFDCFIKKQGGHDNAATDWDTTKFYFVVQTRNLRTALDKFAQFFIAPLLNKDAMQRERQAIESEFKLALPSDYHRKKQLLGSLAKNYHPATKFSWGNVDTLGGGLAECQDEKDSEIHTKLHTFRHKHYVAPSMTLAVQSRHDLDSLQNWVQEIFSQVPRGSTENIETVPTNDSLPFQTPQFNKFFRVKPVKDICQLDLTWGLPSLLQKYRSKPEKYVSWLLGHEGKGSLLSYLREKVWVLQLYCGSDDSGADHNSHYLQFGLSLVLTAEGLAHLEEVLQSVFSYLSLLREVGPDERIFREIQKIADIRFRFNSEAPSLDNVEMLSENMQKYPSDQYITGSELFFEYDPKEIKTCIHSLRTDNVNIMLLDKDSSTEYDHIEKWFNTPYSSEDIPSQWRQAWDNAKPMSCFHMPEPNPYISSDFSIISGEKSENSEKIPRNKHPDEVYPQKIMSDDKGELWFKQDKKFLLPKAHMYFQLVSPVASLSSTHSALLDLMISILKQQLTSDVYAAELADLSYAIYPSIEGTGQGLGIFVSGYNHKLSLLLETVLRHLLQFHVKLSSAMFKAMKDKQKKMYYNTFLKPSKLVKDLAGGLLKSNHCSNLDKHAAITDVTISQLADFSQQLLARMYVRGLIQGNLSHTQAHSVILMVRSILDYKALLPNTWTQLRLAQAEVGSRLCRVASFNRDSPNSVVTHNFQCGLANILDCCVAEMVMMLLEEAAFDTLRTKEQLGYDVSCHQSVTRGVLNISICVHCQADKHNVAHVDSRIWSMLRGFQEDLSKLGLEELEEMRHSAMQHKLTADLQLQEEVDRNWDEICSDEQLFNRRHLEHSTLACISLEDMINWLQRYVFGADTTRHISYQVEGYSDSCITEKTQEDSMPKLSFSDGKEPFFLQYIVDGENKSKFITSIEEYKKALYFYPVHKVLS